MGEIDVGAIVQLKGGGAKMTVTRVSGKTVTCSWHDQQNKPCKEDYPADALKLVSPPKKRTKPHPDRPDIGRGSDSPDLGGHAASHRQTHR
jgi:uncharacterized protein YodC (DUF2158 family)